MPDELLRSALRVRPECPPIELLSVHLGRTAEDPARVEAELHVQHCLHCRTELDLLAEFEEGAIHPDEAPAVEWIASRLRAKPAAPEAAALPVRWWTRWRVPKMAFGFAAVAALVLLGVGLVNEMKLRNAGQRPVPEFGDEVQRTRSIEVIQARDYFRWKPVPSAVRYELTVRTVDDAVVFHNFFTEPALAFPAPVAELVSTGKLLLWEVAALDASGNLIASSGVQRLRKQSLP